jgi:tol-pal system protein YbgF
MTAALVLAGCASDDSGVRALNETTTLRTQLDDMRQRQDTSSREITRLQSQVRALETDAVDKTRDVKAANVELARARVLLEETRGMLREREAAAASAAPERPTAMVPPPAAPPSPPPSPITPPPPVKSTASRPVAPDPRAIPDSTNAAKPAPTLRSAPEATAPESKAAPEPKPVAAPPVVGKPMVRPVSAAAPSAEKLFSAAMANFRVQEHGQAVLELTDLITRYPSHSLAPAAQLWIGEAYYQQHDYRQALIELKRVSEAYPRSPQIADALLKSGLCHRALGDRAAARAAWAQVVRDHPSSAAAGQARSLLGASASAK